MTVTEKAYAKINLFLDVTGRREDGFHDVVSVMHSVSLCDIITLSATPSDERNISIISSDPTLETDKNNLIHKSAIKYMSYFGINAKADVVLEKNIPIGAGLGGGSSDAAATIRAMNKIYGLASKEQLLEMAAELGSDVPFCIDGGCAVCTGRGEKIRPFNVNLDSYFVISIGERRVSTPLAYKLLDEKYNFFEKANTNNFLFDNANVPNYNIFEQIVDFEEIDEIKSIMIENGSVRTLMSGSGPAVFGNFSSLSEAISAEKSLKDRGCSAFRCELA